MQICVGVLKGDEDVKLTSIAITYLVFSPLEYDRRLTTGTMEWS